MRSETPEAEAQATETQLRAEIASLKQRLAAQHEAPHGHGHVRRRPSGAALFLIGLLIAAAAVGAFFAGFLPHQKRQTELIAQAKTDGETAPVVNVTGVERSSGKSELVLPGNIQAITEAPVLSRASGYVKKRFVDIGDRVKAGQLLAEIDASELDNQVRQAKASVDQTNASLEQASANLVQGRTNEQLYKTTSDRFGNLVQKGAVSRQEYDNYLAQYTAQQATVQAMEKAIGVAKSNVAVAEANLARLTDMQGYLKVKAPFAGVITVRNVDTGALVTEGSTLLFRIAQTDRLRIYTNVPQSDAAAVRVGQPAKITISDMPSKEFPGTVTRTANSLDPSSRTLLAEVQVSNGAALLMPGMYAQVNFTTPRSEPPLLIRGDALVIRANGPQVAVVMPDETVHFQTIGLGRDYGDRIEVLSGLKPGEQLVINPGDNIQEHA
ncbi:MAG: efflux RND transporter periplasmic adaptor subunit, partial [Acidobacteriota bacterium]